MNLECYRNYSIQKGNASLSSVKSLLVWANQSMLSICLHNCVSPCMVGTRKIEAITVTNYRNIWPNNFDATYFSNWPASLNFRFGWLIDFFVLFYEKRILLFLGEWGIESASDTGTVDSPAGYGYGCQSMLYMVVKLTL